MVNLLDLLHQKLELFRLEQRYTKRRHRRSTFVSEAMYVDGEYVYTNPPSHNTTGSSNTSYTSSSTNTSTKTSSRGPSKRSSIVDFRTVRTEETPAEHQHEGSPFGTEGNEGREAKSSKRESGNWGRSRWNAGRARDKRMSVAVVREVPVWEEENDGMRR